MSVIAQLHINHSFLFLFLTPQDVGMDALIVDVARHMHGRSTSQEQGLYLRDLVRDRVGEKREKETSDW